MGSRGERELRQSDARLQHRAREPVFMSTLCQAARILQLIYSSQPSSCGVPPHATDVEHRGICLRSPVPVTPVPGLTPALPTEHLRRPPPPRPPGGDLAFARPDPHFLLAGKCPAERVFFK